MEDLVRQLEAIGRDAGSIPPREEAPEPGSEQRMLRLRGELASMGDVDDALIREAREMEERHAFLTREAEDLERAVADLRNLITDLQARIRKEFSDALEKINTEFGKFFGLMFGGGEARLVSYAPRPKAPADGEEASAEDGEDALDAAGVEIEIRLPKKRLSSLDVLSGGERSLVGIAALFALISVSPPPFLVLDEIDAPLDERNARRFGEMLREFSKHTQFVLVTHNRATMESADVLYGVTLDPDGSSKVVSLKFSGDK